MSPPSPGCVVVTTINPPSEAIARFAALPGWRLVVVGDRKTPEVWEFPGVDFIPLAQQERSDYRIARELPRDHYCRKMFGYLEAVAGGAQVIVDSDDDNLIKSGWGFPVFDGAFCTTAADLGFVNMYSWFGGTGIWPRGFPLRRIRDPRATIDPAASEVRPARVGVWQALADGDPDVDAIYHLTDGRSCSFGAREPIVLERGTCSPFNSQNTAIRAELAALLYLPCLATFRFTDILRGLVAQPILWAHGFRLGFIGATVVHERNPHDSFKDFLSELPCYVHAERVVGTVTEAVSPSATMAANLVAAYACLAREGVVPDGELRFLEAWLEDLDRAALKSRSQPRRLGSPTG